MSQISLTYSMVTDTTNNLHANGLHVDDNFNTLLDAVNNKVDVDGTSVMSADLSMNSYKITNLLAGTNPGDAINKYQLDTAISSIPKASAAVHGLVKIGSNIDVSDGTISLDIASTTKPGLVQLGRTNTVDNARTAAVRKSIITQTVPSTGEDGVIYFVYAV